MMLENKNFENNLKFDSLRLRHVQKPTKTDKAHMRMIFKNIDVVTECSTCQFENCFMLLTALSVIPFD